MPHDKRPPRYPEETPTEPDLRLLDCPACKVDGVSSGWILVVTFDGSVHDYKTARCNLCHGVCKVPRSQFTIWKRRQETDG
jgi:hypothetical protein